MRNFCQRIIIARNIFVDNVSYEDVCSYVDNILKERTNELPRFIFAQNPLKVAMAAKQPALLQILKSADVLIPDGTGIVLGAKLAGAKIRGQVTGVDLMRELISLASDRGYSVYFLGGKEGVAEKAAGNLAAEYPVLKISGAAHGYFSPEDEIDVINRINESSADILFVAMGSPAQELFLQRNRSRIRASICMGVGGSFDVYAGNVKRAPSAFRKLGLEWLFRLVTEPKRFRRITGGLCRYMLILISGIWKRQPRK